LAPFVKISASELAPIPLLPILLHEVYWVG
jgi:hypothetical protein